MLSSSIKLETSQLQEKKKDYSSRDNRRILIKIIIKRNKTIRITDKEVKKINKTIRDRVSKRKRKKEISNTKIINLEKFLKKLKNDNNYIKLYDF